MRSLLFAPGDDARKLARAMASGADALILDLEDSVAPSGKVPARQILRDFIFDARRGSQRPRLFVRINGLETSLADADLDAIMPAGPDGIMLPKSRSGADVQHLGAKLAVREAQSGLPDGACAIIPLVTETAASLFGLSSYAGASQRLLGMAWGAEDLSAALGAQTNRLPDGAFTAPYQLARTLTLVGARAAQVEPIDTVFTAFRDEAGLRRDCEAALRDGFTAKMAIHPAQVPIINAIFTPAPEAVARAQAIVAAFAKNPQAAVIALGDEMLDRPQLLQAKGVLARAR
jgi:citrate lyase subunit beta/citryl-CoA lyase